MPRAGRAEAPELGEGAGLWRGRWGCCAMCRVQTYCPAAQRACGGTAAVRGHWDSAGELCLALLAASLSSPYAVIPALYSNPCPAPVPSPTAPKTLLLARELGWISCRFGSVRKTKFDHLCSVSVLLKLARLLILPLLPAFHCK